MNERQMQNALHNLIENLIDAQRHDKDIEMPDGMGEFGQVHDFAEAGLLASNKGLVITMKDGSEFQVTIVQSH